MLSLKKNYDLVNFLSIFIFLFFTLSKWFYLQVWAFHQKSLLQKKTNSNDYACQSVCHDLSQSIRCKIVMRRLRFFLHVTETFLVVKKQIQAEFVDYL